MAESRLKGSPVRRATSLTVAVSAAALTAGLMAPGVASAVETPDPVPQGTSPDAPASEAPEAGLSTAIVGLEARKKKKAKKITGKVRGGSGYQLLLVTSKGKVTRTTLGGGRFKLKTPKKPSSLLLVDRAGHSAGPIVAGVSDKKAKGKKKVKGTKAYVFLKKKRAVNLGTIKLKSGYAAPSRKKQLKLAKSSVEKSRSARAVRGVPVGVAGDGYVSSKYRSFEVNRATRALEVGGDADRDGIVALADVDLNNNGVLNNADTGAGAPAGPSIFTNYKATAPNFSDTINTNIGSFTQSQIDLSVRTKATIAVPVGGSGATLNCLSLSYCPSPPTITPGGTGDYQMQPGLNNPALVASDIQAGDKMIKTEGGSATTFLLNLMFNYTPALKSYEVLTAGTGAGATSVNYSSGSPSGSTNNPIEVPTGSTVRLTFYAPQRPGFSTDPAPVMNMGHLRYRADAPNSDAGSNYCSLTTDDANLTGSGETVTDTRADSIPGASNTTSFIVDPSSCMTVDSASPSANGIDIQALSTQGDNAAQKVGIRLVS